jgi:hypothetical protein
MWKKDYEETEKVQMKTLTKCLYVFLGAVGALGIAAGILATQSNAKAAVTDIAQPRDIEQFIFKTIDGRKVQVNSWRDGNNKCTALTAESGSNTYAPAVALSCVKL